jgi:23S rRNA (cytosine1962-C5)-methyltransferase
MIKGRVVIKSTKSEAVGRYHPWIFSGAIAEIEGGPEEGDLVTVLNHKGHFIGLGHYGKGGIAVRMISFEKPTSIGALIANRIDSALILRKNLGLLESTQTNAFRLFNGEGDGWSGLVIDIYNSLAVIQCHHPGIYPLAGAFGEYLQKSLGDKITGILIKNDFRENREEMLIGVQTETEILENNLRFYVNVSEGQKTGFFLDQRDNRQMMQEFAAGKTVGNFFCYSGGFSVYALQAGAEWVDSVDSSAKAIDWTTKNIELNYGKERHQAHVQDVFDFMKQQEKAYDLLILDPPAFAKKISSRHQAIQAYKRLNEQAIRKIKPGGFIFTFSCSQVVTREFFEGAVLSAAIDAGRSVRIVRRLAQPGDHPVNIFHPEGSYLKGLVLYVD